MGRPRRASRTFSPPLTRALEAIAIGRKNSRAAKRISLFKESKVTSPTFSPLYARSFIPFTNSSLSPRLFLRKRPQRSKCLSHQEHQKDDYVNCENDILQSLHGH